MTQTWFSNDPPPPPLGFTRADYARIARRGVPLALNTFGCLLLLLLLRVIEWPLFGHRRPITPFITRYVCRSAFWILGMGYQVSGQPMTGPGALAANHVSWLDIFALNAPQRIYFVSKAEVAGWPGIGWLARATGTLFIERKRSEAAAHTALFQRRLSAGHRLVFFPEGTSTDGFRVLPFRSTLFAAFFDPEHRQSAKLQAVSLRYVAPEGEDPRVYGWWGDMSFEGHLLRVLAMKRPGAVRVLFHPPHDVSTFEDRKQAARRLEDEVRAGLAEGFNP